MRISKFLYQIQVVIDRQLSEEELEEDYNERIPSHRPFPADIERVLNTIARAEYCSNLEQIIFEPPLNDKIGITSGVSYCLPIDLGVDLFDAPNIQHIDKILRWNVSLDTPKECECLLNFYIFYRDAAGNFKNLHHNPISQKLTLYPDEEHLTHIEIEITRDDDKPFDCGRYYLAVQSNPPYAQLNKEPAVIYLNILPPAGKIERVASSLVGLDAVYNQMGKLVTQKLFNEQREAMGMLPTQINLNAAVMGGRGSGKTSFAHVIFDFYKKNGLLADGDLRVIDASRWGAFSEDNSAVGSDMTKARNGLLYIENAAAMIPADTRGNREYLVQTLIREMKQNSHNTTVVLADEPEKLTELLAIGELSALIGQVYHLPTLNIDQMLEVAINESNSRGFYLTDTAQSALRIYLSDMPNATATDVVQIVDDMIVNMSSRVLNNAHGIFLNNTELTELTDADVPHREISKYDRSIGKLNNLVGLKKLKYSIESHLNLVRFAQLRTQHGLTAAMPPLHMIFTGNPGTGKTTVANLLGEIYASLGILKTGKVISVDRKKLVGRYIGDTEDNTKRVLRQAHGNILFIDEAYDLVGDIDDKRDFGPKVIDCLLEELGKESTDMIIIMAGYPDDMEKLLNYNKGLQSRFPYTFHFEDYTQEELLEIAIRSAQQCGYAFSDEALKKLNSLIQKEMERSAGREEHFGNARFITRLISTQIIPNMSRRVLASQCPLTTTKLLSQIEAADIPASVHEADYMVDEQLLATAVKHLDSMIGLSSVKKNLHDLVTIARTKQQTGEDIWKTIPLQWLFTGSTGTGKSSVAQILAQILHAFHLINSERMTQLRLPHSDSWTPFELDKLLRDTMKQSGQGLLFMDLDDVANNHIDVQWLRCKLTSLMAELPGSHAVVIAIDDRHVASQPIDMPLTTSSIHFPDYTADELMTILVMQLDKHSFDLTPDAEQIIKQHINDMCNNPNCQFANARTIRHIFTAVTGAAQVRVAQLGEYTTPLQITAGDVESFTWKMNTNNRIGFTD